MLSDTIFSWGGQCPSIAKNCVVKNWREKVDNKIAAYRTWKRIALLTNKHRPLLSAAQTNSLEFALVDKYQREGGKDIAARVWLARSFHLPFSPIPYQNIEENKQFENISRTMSNQKVHQNFSFCIGCLCIHLSVTNFQSNTACGGRQ